MNIVFNFDFGITEVLTFLIQLLFLRLSNEITKEKLPSNLSWVKLIAWVFVKLFLIFYFLMMIITLKMNASNIIAYLFGFVIYLPKIDLPNPTIYGKKLW